MMEWFSVKLYEQGTENYFLLNVQEELLSKIQTDVAFAAKLFEAITDSNTVFHNMVDPRVAYEPVKVFLKPDEATGINDVAIQVPILISLQAEEDGGNLHQNVQNNSFVCTSSPSKIVDVSKEGSEVDLKGVCDDLKSPPKKKLSVAVSPSQPSSIQVNTATCSNEDIISKMKTCSPFKNLSKQSDKDKDGEPFRLRKRATPIVSASSSDVMVSNISPPFCEETFKAFMEALISRKGISAPGMRCIKQCSSYNEQDNCVILKFEKQEHAWKVSNLKGVNYLCDDISFSLVDSFSPGNLVEISNISSILSPFRKEVLIDFLTKALQQVDNSVKHKQLVKKCHDYDPMNNSVELEMATAEIAKSICRLDGVMFLLQELHIKPSHQSGPLKIESGFLRISNILVFNEAIFTNFLKTAMMRNNIVKEGLEPIRKCHQFQEHTKSVVLELISEHVVEEVCLKLKGLRFLRQELKFMKWFIQEENNNALAQLPYASVERPCQSVREGSKKVEVFNIPGPFDKIFFEAFLVLELEQQNIARQGTDVILNFSDYNSLSKSVIVEFTTHEVSKAVSLLEDVYFMHDRLTFCLVEERNHSNNQQSKGKVLVSNIPSTFEKDDFIQFMHSKMKEACFCDNETIILDCSERADDWDSVMLTFTSEEFAHLACCLEKVTYKGEELSLDMQSQTSEHGGSGDKQTMPKTLNDPEGFNFFVRALLKYKALFASNKGHAEGLIKVKNHLSKNGVIASIQDLKNKRRNLLAKYRRMKGTKSEHTHKFSKAFAVLAGVKDASSLKGTEFDIDESQDSDDDDFELEAENVDEVNLDIYTKGKPWTTAATKAIIAICVHNKAEYDKPKRHTKFWLAVSNQLKDDYKLMYTATQCEYIMEKNKKLFRNEAQRLATTGEEGPSATKIFWPFFDDMLPLMQGDVSVWPLVVAAAGTNSYVAKAQKSAGCLSTMVEIPEASGSTTRSRIPVLKKVISPSERRVAALETVASSVKAVSDQTAALTSALLSRIQNK